jgi:hypothetical protein
MTQDEGTAPHRPAGELPTVAAITLIAVMSTGTMFLTPSLALFGPIAGVAAALGVRGPLRAGATAAGGVVMGTLVASVARVASFASWGPVMLRDALVAALVAIAVRWVLERSPRLASWAAAFGLVLVIASGWWAASVQATLPLHPGVTRVGYLASSPTMRTGSSDEDIYLAYIHRMARGEAYYPAAVAVLSASNIAHPLGPIRIDTPLSYRLPTLYWLLSRLPADGWSLVWAMLSAGSMAAVAAYVLARQYVVAPLALASAAGLTGLYATYATVPGLLHAEIWAGALALVAVALFVLARRRPPHAMALMVAVAVAALAAAAVRELAAPVVALGLALTALHRDTRRQRLWVPWAVALGVTSAGYVAHWAAATAAFRAAALRGPAASDEPGWWHPDGRGLYGGVDFFRSIMAWPLAAGWVAAASGLVGAIVGPRERLQRLMTATLVGGGMLVVLFLRPTGSTSTGAPVGYWSEIYVPTMVACIPLALAWLPGARRLEGRAPVESDASGPAI